MSKREADGDHARQDDSLAVVKRAKGSEPPGGGGPTSKAIVRSSEGSIIAKVRTFWCVKARGRKEKE